MLKALLTLPAALGTYQTLLASDDNYADVGSREPVVNAHGGPIVPPVPVPDARLQLADGTHADLRNLVGGKSTAVQLVFTRCTTTCPGSVCAG